MVDSLVFICIGRESNPYGPELNAISRWIDYKQQFQFNVASRFRKHDVLPRNRLKVRFSSVRGKTFNHQTAGGANGERLDISAILVACSVGETSGDSGEWGGELLTLQTKFSLQTVKVRDSA